MAVVAAGVHTAAAARFEGHVVCFLYGQGVYVGPQGHSFSRMIPFNLGDYARMLLRIHFARNAHVFQDIDDSQRRPPFLKARFRIFVKLPPPLANLSFVCFHICFNHIGVVHQ